MNIKQAIIVLLLPVMTGVAYADTDKKTLAHGGKLHAEHCQKCHTDQVYTRDDRFVKSLDALSKQVKRCKTNTNAPWFDEDTDAVVHFLNNKYYKF